MTAPPDGSGRADQVAAALAVVRDRIARACDAADRDPADVRLIVVTKFFPASDVRLLADLGVTDVAENRHQEAEAKAAECADLDLAWHFVGGLQSNKAAAVTRYAACVHSLDRRQAGRPARPRRPRAPATRRCPVGRRGSPSTCCSRSASTRRVPTTAAGSRPTTWPPSPSGSRPPSRCGCGA